MNSPGSKIRFLTLFMAVAGQASAHDNTPPGFLHMLQHSISLHGMMLVAVVAIIFAVLLIVTRKQKPTDY